MKVVVAGALLAWQAVAGAQDAVRVGEAEFKRSCASCHSVDAALTPMAGPGLHGVVGRKLGTAPRFSYSDAMAAGGEAGAVWTREMLAAFIADPGAVVPDTAMPSPALNEAQRSAVVAYLASLSGAAPAAAPKA
ncbi:c-type cytochrome, partial [Massilia arenosa]